MKIPRMVAAVTFLATFPMMGILSGCGGGWGAAKPTVAGTSSSSNGVTGSGNGQVQALTVVAGQPATFSASAQGTGPFTYQWFVNGQLISGATSSTYAIPSATSSLNGAVYTVQISNAAGTITAGPFTLTVQMPPAITEQPSNQTVTAGQPAIFAVGATGTGPLSYQWSENGSPVAGATSATLTVPAVGVGNSGANFSVAVSNVAGAVTSTSATLTVNPILPTLAFTPVPSEIYGNAPFPVIASSASSGVITYTVVSGPATLSGNTVTITGAGTVVLGASQAAAGNFAPATATTSFAVGDEMPTLSFSSIASKTYGEGPFPVTATSASSGAITYTVVSGPATLSGNTVTITGAGTVVLGASQAAAGNFAPATATTSFVVSPEAPTLTFSLIASQTYGNAPFPVTASSASTGAITYTVVSGPATISGDLVTLTGAGPVEVMASQAASGNYTSASAIATFSVAGETPSINFPSPGPQAYSATTFPVSATSNSTGLITFSVVSGPATIAGNEVTMTGAGMVTLQANQAASGNYGTGTATTTFNITATSPQITQQPVSENICANQALTLSVTATNATAYQWYLDGIAIPGATASTYSVATAVSANTGNYTVGVSNPTLTVISQVATVNVGATIVTNPANLTITQYQEGSFSVAANGSGHYSYQWYTLPTLTSPLTDGTLISGATSSLYVTAPQTSAPASAIYAAQVTDTTCNQTISSNPATLTVDAGNSPPTITLQPFGQTVASGGGATFTANATGTPSLTYQWYRIPNGGTNAEIAGTEPQAGTAVSGATSASYTVPSNMTEDGNDQDQYYVVATNAYGSAVSQNATLAVDQGIQIQITGEPANQYLNPGQSATFSVTATTNSSSTPLTYQWYSVPPGESGAQQTIYTLPIVTVNSNRVPTTTTIPGAAQLIPGATSNTLTVSNVAANQTGTVYYVTVSNGTASSTSTVYSSTAVLTVGQPTGITTCANDWGMLGDTTAIECGYELVNGANDEQGEIVWPTLIPTGNMQLSFTITTSNVNSGQPADGFTMTLGDPSLGATLQSLGQPGEGIGAKGIPGFVLAFDDYPNPACASGCYPGPYVADPTSTAFSGDPDYLGVGRGETNLWENPYFNVNFNLPIPTGDTYSLADVGKTITHSYVVSIVNGYMSVTMDATQVFSGSVSVPPVAYLYLTASTGGDNEEVQISNISATINAPSN